MTTTKSISRRELLRRGVGVSLATGFGYFALGDNIARAAYPNYSFSLRVPFLKQADPPGDWANTKNCGQTCSVMLGGYFKGRPVSPSQITACNTWLANITGNAAYNNANGYYTNFSGSNTLGRLLSEYYGLRYGLACGSDPSAVVNEAAAGRPCIVGVRISGGNLVASGGVAHWALVIGWNGRIVVNDPGSSSGGGKTYSISTFDASWSTSGRTYCPVRM